MGRGWESARRHRRQRLLLAAVSLAVAVGGASVLPGAMAGPGSGARPDAGAGADAAAYFATDIAGSPVTDTAGSPVTDVATGPRTDVAFGPAADAVDVAPATATPRLDALAEPAPTSPARVPAPAPGPAPQTAPPPSGTRTSVISAASRDEAPAGPSLQSSLVLLGSATIAYEAGPENGDGANIQIPLRHLDRLVLRPGATFDFWKAVGEVSHRTGYRRGALIVGDHVDPRGALAGGICTVSTALFDAAARAGLEIVTRHGHGGYLPQYPLGLDAAVTKAGRARQDLVFRNDTDEAIIIRTVSTPGIARVDLYAAAPLGRRVAFTDPVVRHPAQAHDRRVRTTALPQGQSRRLQPRSDGMTVSVVRTVRDATGHLLHRDRWVSTYRPLSGLVQVGAG